MSQIEKLSDPNKRIDVLLKRCNELYADMKRHENESKKLKKRADTHQKERDAARGDLSKSNNTRGKLEGLCRQLQKDNNDLRVRPSYGVAPFSA
jgi:chromosome segregation ATPase